MRNYGGPQITLRGIFIFYTKESFSYEKIRYLISFEDFIIDYFFGVYYFYLDPLSDVFVFGVNRVSERISGIKVLIEWL